MGRGEGVVGHTKQQVLTSMAAVVKDMGHQVAAGIQAALTASTQGSPRKGEGNNGGGLWGYGREYSKSHIAQLPHNLVHILNVEGFRYIPCGD